MKKQVSIQFPLIDLDATPEQQFAKLIEEFQELGKEIAGKEPVMNLLHEAQDVMQTLIGFVVVLIKEEYELSNEEVFEIAKDVLKTSNDLHKQKIKEYIKTGRIKNEN